MTYSSDDDIIPSHFMFRISIIKEAFCFCHPELFMNVEEYAHEYISI